MAMTSTPALAVPSSAATTVGARIRRARIMKGLSQAQLGEGLNKTQTAVSYWEAGRRSPDLDDLIELADVLDVPVSYFFERSEAKPKEKSGKKRVLLRAEATLRPFEFLSSEIAAFADFAEDTMEPLAGKIRVAAEDPTRAAQQLLAQAHVTKTPIEVVELAARCGVNVVEWDFSDEISGLLLDLDVGPVIGFNGIHAPTRQRFTIAHELGHFLLDHHDHFHIDLSEQESLGASPGYRWQDERAANDFAAQLLMPAAFVTQAFAKTKSLGQLASEFDVSSQAMGFRLLNLGLVR
jgi:Zn-dependent peptidase ImmA (M78 family)/transcriptional regulator with XRE-family HTH domain